jgi:hypothetical protein
MKLKKMPFTLSSLSKGELIISLALFLQLSEPLEKEYLLYKKETR